MLQYSMCTSINICLNRQTGFKHLLLFSHSSQTTSHPSASGWCRNGHSSPWKNIVLHLKQIKEIALGKSVRGQLELPLDGPAFNLPPSGLLPASWGIKLCYILWLFELHTCNTGAQCTCTCCNYMHIHHEHSISVFYSSHYPSTIPLPSLWLLKMLCVIQGIKNQSTSIIKEGVIFQLFFVHCLYIPLHK